MTQTELVDLISWSQLALCDDGQVIQPTGEVPFALLVGW